MSDDATRMADSFLTITARVNVELKVQNSRFLAFAFPLDAPASFSAIIDGFRKQFHDASHHTFAWRIGMDRAAFRFSDDGEPSGTAGKRILASIDHRDLTNAGIVVVRYFGGVKLGVGGLSKAYAEAADLVLERAAIERQYLLRTFRVSFPYELSSQAHYALEKTGAVIIDREYLESPVYTVSIRASLASALLDALAEATQRSAMVEPLGD
jgi:uncharacterized YigZ family protein